MSARQIARLRALIEEKKREAEEVNEDIEEEEYYEEPSKVSFSAFIDSDSEEEEEEEEEEVSTESEEVVEVVPVSAKPQPSKEELEDAFLDALLAEQQEEQTVEENHNTSDTSGFDLGRILQINTKRLNDTEETNSRFGGNDENQRAMGRGYRQRQRAIRRSMAGAAGSSIFITPSPSNVRPPSIVGGGFSFDSVETPFNFDKGSLVAYDSNAVFYSIHASREYQHLVEEYKSYKATYLTEDIGEMAIRFYQKHPYLLHVAFDLCQIMLMYKDAEHVLEILRQCLYIIEMAVGPRFDFASGKARFLYSEEENRVVYKTLRLYVQMSYRKSCFDTALNTSLILYSFFPQLDPTGALLLIPFLAISAKRFQSLIHIAESSLAIGPLPIIVLPNWGFDYGLALYRLGEVEKARQQIRESLKQWPSMPKVMKEYSTSSLYVPDVVQNFPLFAQDPEDENAKLMLEIFGQRESQQWGHSDSWTLLMECYMEMIQTTDLDDWRLMIDQNRDDFIAVQDYFDRIYQVSEIGDNLFTVDPADFLDELPTADMNEIMGDLRQQQLEQQLENQLAGMRVANNVPADHNMLRLFLEALNPNMNAAELNDDDVAALEEQMNEMLDAGIMNGQEGEGEWQQDWNSDEE